jgi:hypothetical protein
MLAVPSIRRSSPDEKTRFHSRDGLLKCIKQFLQPLYTERRVSRDAFVTITKQTLGRILANHPVGSDAWSVAFVRSSLEMQLALLGIHNPFSASTMLNNTVEQEAPLPRSHSTPAREAAVFSGPSAPSGAEGRGSQQEVISSESVRNHLALLRHRLASNVQRSFARPSSSKDENAVPPGRQNELVSSENVSCDDKPKNNSGIKGTNSAGGDFTGLADRSGSRRLNPMMRSNGQEDDQQQLRRLSKQQMDEFYTSGGIHHSEQQALPQVALGTWSSPPPPPPSSSLYAVDGESVGSNVPSPLPRSPHTYFRRTTNLHAPTTTVLRQEEGTPDVEEGEAISTPRKENATPRVQEKSTVLTALEDARVARFRRTQQSVGSVQMAAARSPMRLTGEASSGHPQYHHQQNTSSKSVSPSRSVQIMAASFLAATATPQRSMLETALSAHFRLSAHVMNEQSCRHGICDEEAGERMLILVSSTESRAMLRAQAHHQEWRNMQQKALAEEVKAASEATKQNVNGKTAAPTGDAEILAVRLIPADSASASRPRSTTDPSVADPLAARVSDETQNGCFPLREHHDEEGSDEDDPQPPSDSPPNSEQLVLYLSSEAYDREKQRRLSPPRAAAVPLFEQPREQQLGALIDRLHKKSALLQALQNEQQEAPLGVQVDAIDRASGRTLPHLKTWKRSFDSDERISYARQHFRNLHQQQPSHWASEVPREEGSDRSREGEQRQHWNPDEEEDDYDKIVDHEGQRGSDPCTGNHRVIVSPPRIVRGRGLRQVEPLTEESLPEQQKQHPTKSSSISHSHSPTPNTAPLRHRSRTPPLAKRAVGTPPRSENGIHNQQQQQHRHQTLTAGAVDNGKSPSGSGPSGSGPTRTRVVEFIRAVLQPLYNKGDLDPRVFANVVRVVSREFFSRTWRSGSPELDAKWQLFLHAKLSDLLGLRATSL